MSNFRAMTRAKNEAIANGVDKRLKDWQPATWLDNYFGKNKHGVRFDGDGVVRVDNGDFEYSKLIRPGHNVELPRCWADSNTPNTPQTAATVLSDDELRAEIFAISDQVYIPNDTKDYTGVKIGVNFLELMQLITQQRQAYADARSEIVVAGKCIKFSHTAVNLDMHMFIDGYHNPTVCPECIVPGTLVATLTPTKETEK